MHYYQEPVNTVLTSLETDPSQGLTGSEAKSRLEKYGISTND